MRIRPEFKRIDCPKHGIKFGYCEECAFPKPEEAASSDDFVLSDPKAAAGEAYSIFAKGGPAMPTLPADKKIYSQRDMEARRCPKLHVLFEGMARVYDRTEADALFESLESELQRVKEENSELNAREAPEEIWRRGFESGQIAELHDEVLPYIAPERSK